MNDNIGVNEIILEEEDDPSKLEYRYNFVNIPWDDRSNRSKFGIVALLVVILAVIMACVINNYVMYFRGFNNDSNAKHFETSCYRVKPADYPFVARIHSLATKELLCVAAVLSSKSFLADGVCIKSGPIRIQIGSLSDPQCKKGFAVDSVEHIYTGGAQSKGLVLLSSYEDKKNCIETLTIGHHISLKCKLFVMGRSANYKQFERLSRQYVTLVGDDDNGTLVNNILRDEGHNAQNTSINSVLCVKVEGHCPVKVGDLLVENNMLFGLAITSEHSSKKSNYACFNNLKDIGHQLKTFDPTININR